MMAANKLTEEIVLVIDTWLSPEIAPYSQEETSSENELDPCNNCNEAANKYMIQFRNCMNWLHYKCTQLTKYQVQAHISTNRKFNNKECIICRGY